MKWFDGIISEAVAVSRKNNSVFVVLVEGDDEKSQNLLHFTDDSDVSQLLESQHFVAIKIKANSTSYFQFAEFYKQVPIPSIYFIGKSGMPLDIVVDVKDAKDLQQKVLSVLEKHGVKQPVLSSEAVAGTSVMNNFLKAAASTSTNTEKLNENVAKEKTEETNQEKSIEDKVEHAKQLLEKQKEKKKAEENEQENLQEIERRKMGQNVLSFKKWQQDQEYKQLMEQREKEKKEQQAARQRILAQIEQDKADRAAKFQTNPPTTTTTNTTKTASTSKKPATVSGARLQLKMPDGSSYTKYFEENSTLQDVRNYVNELELGFTNFILSTTFPRREFTAEDANSTLIELELVPTAVILVLPLSNGAVSTNPGSFFTMILWSFVTPLLSLFGYMRRLISGNPSRNAETQSLPGDNRSSSSSIQNSKRPIDSKNDENKSYKKKNDGESGRTVVKRQGNIHRLSDKTDSEDENNTWNGNSTQQM